MADGSALSAAKIVLLAVQLASTADITSLRYLVASHPKTLRRENLILRILLTFLPETLESSAYIPLLNDLTSETIQDPPKSTTFPPLDEDMTDEDARKRVRKLHLIRLIPPNAFIDSSLDPLTIFLILRAYRVDSAAGLLPQILALLVPFLDHSDNLRTWTIVTLLPLLRFCYYYYPKDGCTRTLEFLESLDNAKGVQFLLSKADVEAVGNKGYEFIGRDLKGLIGPWMYQDMQRKRGNDGIALEMAGRTILPLEDANSKDVIDCSWPGWDQVFKWIMSRAESSWPLAVDAIEQWDGPGDVDLGNYEGATVWLEDENQRVLEIRYARTALATAYLVREDSVEAQTGVYRILTRIISLLDYERIPTLPASASLLPSISFPVGNDLISPENSKYLHSLLLDERNILTSPTQQATSLLHALTTSAYLLTRAGCSCSVKKAGELALLGYEQEQKTELQRFINAASKVSKSDDKYWMRIRNEILWLRDWTSESILDTNDRMAEAYGNGVFGHIGKEYLEEEILKALLANDKLALARSIYENPEDKPLSIEKIETVVMNKSRAAFEGATNGNKTRGGVKKSVEILHAFRDSLRNSRAKERHTILVDVADELAKYRIVIKHGRPFTPAEISAHRDPLALIGNILDNNDSAYTQLIHLCKLGYKMVSCGLTTHEIPGHKSLKPDEEQEQKKLAKKRIVSMCVDAALANDDFETAYSYVMNNPTTPDSELLHHPDDWSWRASLQAGKYRRNANTINPTHLGNASANPEIRHLEQRMECLSQALRIAPKSTLPDILNVFRRCEEELVTQTRLEEEAEAAWDDRADEQAGIKGSNATREVEDETPMSIFDLGRRTAENAKRSLFPLRDSQARNEDSRGRSSRRESDGAHNETTMAPEELAKENETVRKRDVLKNIAVGTLTRGVGWAIGAPSAVQNPDA